MHGSAARCWICIEALQNKEHSGNQKTVALGMVNDTYVQAILHEPDVPRDSNSCTEYIYWCYF